MYLSPELRPLFARRLPSLIASLPKAPRRVMSLTWIELRGSFGREARRPLLLCMTCCQIPCVRPKLFQELVGLLGDLPRSVRVFFFSDPRSSALCSPCSPIRDSLRSGGRSAQPHPQGIGISKIKKRTSKKHKNRIKKKTKSESNKNIP